MNEPQKVTFSQGIHEESSVQKETLGALRILADGRKFRYTHNGGVALVAGVPLTAPDSVANHLDLVVTGGAAVGTSTVTATLGGTAATLNQYKDGYLQVSDGGAAHGEGMQYLIDGNTAQTSTTGDVVLQLRENVRVVITAGTSKVSLIYNPFDMVVATTGGTDLPAGVPPIAVTISYYFWSQTGGMATSFCTNTLGEGIAITNGAALYATTSGTEPVVGWSFGYDGATGVTTPVFLTID